MIWFQLGMLWDAGPESRAALIGQLGHQVGSHSRFLFNLGRIFPVHPDHVLASRLALSVSVRLLRFEAHVVHGLPFARNSNVNGRSKCLHWSI